MKKLISIILFLAIAILSVYSIYLFICSDPLSAERSHSSMDYLSLAVCLTAVFVIVCMPWIRKARLAYTDMKRRCSFMDVDLSSRKLIKDITRDAVEHTKQVITECKKMITFYEKGLEDSKNDPILEAAYSLKIRNENAKIMVSRKIISECFKTLEIHESSMAQELSTSYIAYRKQPLLFHYKPSASIMTIIKRQRTFPEINELTREDAFADFPNSELQEKINQYFTN